ncbi:DUF732 domain-containing protein [Rhodococcus marinonascens]|uniref:DUF732 domain-containing protein n=1 Tax=Rhodococcus marinonascens TaxID=38311 RepID=UPI0009320ED6|nr:DUF732 domain-containing protein [Rhodococcus marinonascens]
MAQHSRFGTTFGRKIAVAALAIAAGGLLVACGSDDVTATSSPSASATTSAAGSVDESSTSEAPDAGASAPVTSPGEAATAPPAQPEALPEEFPGPDQVAVSGDGQRFLDALKSEGIEPAIDGTMAISTADFICQAEAEGKSDSDTMVFVTAMVGTEASAAGRELTQEQVTADAQTYVDVAHATYCR